MLRRKTSQSWPKSTHDATPQQKKAWCSTARVGLQCARGFKGRGGNAGWTESNKLRTRRSKALQASVCHHKVQNELATKGVLIRQHVDSADWDVTKDAQERFPNGFSTWIAKHVTNFCGVGKMMKIWKMWDNSRCQRSDLEVEIAQHALVCPNVDMRNEFGDPMDGGTGKMACRPRHMPRTHGLSNNNSGHARQKGAF